MKYFFVKANHAILYSNLNRKTVWFVLVACILFGQLKAQHSVRVAHVSTQVFNADDVNKQHPNGAFGGISAIEVIPANDMAAICKKCEKCEGYVLFSDKKMGEKANVFYMSKDFKIQQAFSVFDMKDVESVRWNSKQQQLVYSYEKDEVTGVRAVNTRTGKQHTILEMPLPTDNRGIEALTFDHDNSLWMALETGNANCSNKTVSFYNIKYNPKTKSYDGKDTVAYQYPLDKCACLGGGITVIDGTNGNGITEILAVPELPGKLLVLERCFNKQTRVGSTFLYLATVNYAERAISKDKMLFDFNTEDFPSAGRNLEGMCRADGNRLLLVADDNFSSKQIGQLVELKMEFE